MNPRCQRAISQDIPRASSRPLTNEERGELQADDGGEDSQSKARVPQKDAMKQLYAWVPWFNELARTIAGGDELELAEHASKLACVPPDDGEPATGPRCREKGVRQVVVERCAPSPFFFHDAGTVLGVSQGPIEYGGVSCIGHLKADEIFDKRRPADDIENSHLELVPLGIG